MLPNFNSTPSQSQEAPLFYHGEVVTVAPNRLLYDTRLSLQARFFWLLVKSHYPRPYPGVRRLAALAGVSLTTAERYIRELEGAGYLRRIKRPFSKTEYHLYDKPLQEVAREGTFSRVPFSRTRETGTEAKASINNNKAKKQCLQCCLRR